MQGSVGAFGGFVRQWWSEPVDYVAQVEYFGKRGVARAIKTLIGLGTGAHGIITLVVVLPFVGGLAAHVVVASFGVMQILWGWVWCLRPWPSRWTSLAFVVSADIGIAAMVQVDASWLAGLFGFNAFAMISVYLVFFDGPKVLAGHALWTLLSATAFAVQISASTSFSAPSFTVSAVAAITPVVLSPLGVQLGIWAMRKDAHESVTDPLTGLLNRRGLYLHVEDLLRDTPPGLTDVVVVVIDLDRFKDVNDRFGHTVGDEVLIRSARRIKSSVRGSALVARVGGEEFVVVDLADDEQWDFDRIRDAIAAPAEPAVTASVGITSVSLADFTAPGTDRVALLDSSITRADDAMFHAKRKGGNSTTT
ncbi:GGDEF domain-containing protein [Mycobacterium hodleri]|uniref:GGDEF domain-containing protein n=1 Tax=Mycolicibacterium hodleri TaxID=49897 RepID=UPI0021F35956|nr:GGDEF domain-containing protein [Mycolicibacterium hodleri]MCV7133872.1 GGDEF domain-containing protein [Mycolicibacterium hodleri]